MPYYCFNKCQEECLSKIEALALEIGLESKASIAQMRSWEGQPFEEKSYWFNVTYYGKEKPDAPVMLQTFPSSLNHKNPEVLELIKRFVLICRPTRIFSQEYDEYNLSEFQ